MYDVIFKKTFPIERNFISPNILINVIRDLTITSGNNYTICFNIEVEIKNMLLLDKKIEGFFSSFIEFSSIEIKHNKL